MAANRDTGRTINSKLKLPDHSEIDIWALENRKN
jgi:hypothetical protein